MLTKATGVEALIFLSLLGQAKGHTEANFPLVSKGGGSLGFCG